MTLYRSRSTRFCSSEEDVLGDGTVGDVDQQLSLLELMQNFCVGTQQYPRAKA